MNKVEKLNRQVAELRARLKSLEIDLVQNRVINARLCLSLSTLEGAAYYKRYGYPVSLDELQTTVRDIKDYFGLVYEPEQRRPKLVRANLEVPKEKGATE